MRPNPIAFGLLVLLLVIQTCRLSDSQRYARDQWFRADSAEAARDTTRAVSARVAKLLGDSVRGWERRAIQERQEKDALDKALKRERAARVALTVTVPDLRTNVPILGTTDSGDIRRGKFQIRQPPYTVVGAVELPKPPGDGKVDLNIALDPLRLNLRLGCGAKQQGLRSATAAVFGPSWASVALDTVSQSREVCNPPPRKKSLLTDLLKIGAGVVAGWVLHP